MRGLLLGGLMAVVAGPAAAAGEVVRLPNGNVSISARGTPLGTILKQLEGIAPLDTGLVDPKVERSPVHLAVDDVPVALALSAAFDAAGVSYAVWGSDPRDLRIVAFPDGSGPAAGAARRAEVVEPPPLPPEGYLLPNGVRLPPGMSPDDPDVAMVTGPVNVPEAMPHEDPELAEVLAVEAPPEDKKP